MDGNRNRSAVPQPRDAPYKSVVTAVIVGRPLAIRVQRAPSSSDRKTRPSSVPNTTSDPWAARHAVSMLWSNHGSPSLHRTNLVSQSSGLRYNAARRPCGPVDVDSSTVSTRHGYPAGVVCVQAVGDEVPGVSAVPAETEAFVRRG